MLFMDTEIVNSSRGTKFSISLQTVSFISTSKVEHFPAVSAQVLDGLVP